MSCRLAGAVALAFFVLGTAPPAPQAQGKKAPAPPRAPKVEFPDLAAARKAIVDDHAEPYFSLLRTHDMSAKTGAPITGKTIDEQRAECRKRYQAAVLQFSDEEKAFLRAVVAKLHPALSADYPALAAQPWSFLKLQDTVEGGLAHTRGRHIVLPVRRLQRIENIRKRSEAEAVLDAGALVAHEQVHVYQREHPGCFDALYADVWGFRRAPKIEGCPALEAVEVVNPDATDLGWVFPIKKGDATRWIWPRVLFQKAAPEAGRVHRMPADFRMAAVDLEETKDGFRAKLDGNGNPVVGDLMEVREYVDVFQGSTYIYHPAEAAADIFETIIACGVLLPPGMQAEEMRKAVKENYGAFEEWFRKNLK